MKRTVLKLFLSIAALTCLVQAEELDSGKTKVEPDVLPAIFTDLEFFPLFAYRQERFQWNIAGTGGVPNILSELNWRDIQILEEGLGVIFVYDNRVRFQSDLKFGAIISGKVSDSDYNGNNRTLLFSLSRMSVRGETFGTNPEIGYIFHPLDILELIPTTGFVYYESFYEDKSLRQIISPLPEAGVPDGSQLSHCLASTYKARRFGPWIGARAFLTVKPNWIIYGNAQIQLTYFNGKGNWVLRPDLARNGIRQKGTGPGLMGALGLSYSFNTCWKVGFEFTGDWLHIKHGDDERRFASGLVLGRPRLLNDVKWASGGILLRATYKT